MSSLQQLKKTIECLNKTRQVEILKIFLKNNISVSENKNGSFINLSYLTPECLTEINKYLSYINDQDETLEELETVKQEFIKEHFDNKSNENNNKDRTIYSSI
jgi:DNA repair ATPase RecN